MVVNKVLSADALIALVRAGYAYGKGCLLVAAAGDEAEDVPAYPVLYPAAYDHVLAVAGSNSSDQRVSSSGYGSHIDVTAPSVDIPTTNWLTITLPYTYVVESGTSLAAPHVAGLAALIWSVQPSHTVTDVTNVIKWTSEDITASPAGPDWDEYTGWGRIDARLALDGIIIGYVRDFEGNDVSGATVSVSGPTSGSEDTDATGFFHYTGAFAGTYSVQASMSGYGTLPPMYNVGALTYTVTSIGELRLPPEINVVQNWGLEASPNLDNWTTSGAITPVITSAAHTGYKAALLGQSPPVSGGESMISQVIYVTPSLQNPRLSFAYVLSSTDASANDHFEVSVTDGVSTTTVISTCTPVGWTYVSYDLSTYTGAVTLTFKVTQSSDAKPTIVYVDEVCVGSAETDRYVYLPIVLRNY